MGPPPLKPGGRVLFSSLPVPSIVPEAQCGNIPLGIASVALFAERTGARIVPNIAAQDSTGTLGDAALVEFLLKHAPNTIGLSCSVWNIERSLFIAGEVKKKSPRTQIWLGGPDISEDSPFVRDPGAPFDLAIPGEGEIAVAHLLSGIPAQDMGGLLLPGGVRTQGTIRPQLLTDLSPIHDPFIEGLITPEADRVLLAEFKRGCLHGCAYCRYHQGRGGTMARRQNAEIAEFFGFARASRAAEIYVLDPSFEQREHFNDFLRWLSRENRRPVIPLSVELRAETIAPKTAMLLARAGVRKVEAGLQSIGKRTLAQVGRKLDPDDFIAGIDALRAHGIAVKTDLMTGLPLDTPAGLEQTLDFLMKHGLHRDVQVFRTQVLPGTTLRRRARQWGISFHAAPPYTVRSTPAWNPNELDRAFEGIEDRLGIRLSPEARPVIAPWNGARYESRAHAGGGLYQYAFNLDHSGDRAKFRAETFSLAAAQVLLWVKAADANRHCCPMCGAIGRCATANPFSSLFVLIETEPGIALDIADSIQKELDEKIPSRYLERLHWPCGGIRPTRKLLFKLEACARYGDTSWFAEARKIATLLWTVNSNPHAFRRLRHFDCERDFLYFDLRDQGESNHESLFRQLKKSRHADRFLLPGPALHWKWIEFLEK